MASSQRCRIGRIAPNLREVYRVIWMGIILWMYHDLISDISRALTRRSIMHYRGDDGVLWPMTRLRWRKSFRFCMLGQ
jgi:hypothetical protein